MDGRVVNTVAVPGILSRAGQSHLRESEGSFRIVCNVMDNLAMRPPTRINSVLFGPACPEQVNLSFGSKDGRTAPNVVTGIRDGHTRKLPVTCKGCRSSTLFFQETGTFPQVFLRGGTPFGYPGNTGKYALF